VAVWATIWATCDTARLAGLRGPEARRPGGPADRGAWPSVRWGRIGDGLKPLYGRLMALAMWWPG